MRRTLGATAIFLGWLCLPLSALAGLVAFHDMGADTRHNFLPPPTVFGFAGDILVWVIAAAALLALVPAFVAVFARDPSGPLYVAGAVVAGLGVVLLPDDLGRAYGALLIPAGALFAAGGWLIAGAPPGGTAWEIAAVWAYLDHRHQAAVAQEPPISPEPDLEPAPTPAPAPGPALAREPEPALDERVEQPAALTGAARATAASTPGSTEASPESGGQLTCTWCSATIPAGATTCPECHAALDPEPGIDGTAISGLTEVAPELLAYAAQSHKKRERKSLLRRALGIEAPPSGSGDVPSTIGPSNQSALRPPSPEVRAEMARIDSEIAAMSAWTELTPPLEAEPGLALPAEPAAAEPRPAAEPSAAAEPDPAAKPGLGSEGHAAERPARSRRAPRPKA